MEPLVLPIPDIKEEPLEYSIKQDNPRNNNRKPPSIKQTRRNDIYSNRSSANLSAFSVSFRGGDANAVSSELSSSLYDKSCEDSYFSQCFEKIIVIGEGSFGEVIKVYCKEDGLYYAVKRSKQFFRSEKNRQQRLQEVRIYEQFSDNEYCVTLIKAWEQSDRLYMQMELCKESLDQHLREKKVLDEKRIWEILLDILLALKCLHDKNLMHLDIKLDNILIGDDNICKLADFGLVIDVAHANRATEGDSRYIAPELMQGKFTKAADIFSLGIATLELASNIDLPLHGPLWQQLRREIFPESFIQNRTADLKKIIKSMMTSNYLKRPTVNNLLTHHKIKELLAQRRRWAIVKKIKRKYRTGKRALHSTICTLKMFFKNFFHGILTKLGFKRPKQSAVSSFSSLDSLNDSNIEGSPAGRYPIHNHIVNSTPVQRRPRSRQYLRARTEGRDNDDSDFYNDFERSHAEWSDDNVNMSGVRGRIEF